MLLIRNGTVASPIDDLFLPDGAVAVSGSVIEAVGGTGDLEPEYGGDQVIDACGGLIMPGLICAHTHFYGAFARGMPMNASPRDFPDILRELWWKLDRQLTLEEVYYSSLVCIMEAVKAGTTTLFDHHSSPNAIAGSLDEIEEAGRQLGARLCLCYEVSDRDGEDRARKGIEENSRYISKTLGDGGDRFAASFGLHAGFTLSDDTMERCKEANGSRAGFHIHVAEGMVDVDDAKAKGADGPVDRLSKLGMLDERSLAVHCVNVNDGEIAQLANAGASVPHCPESNMNNGVGVAPIPRLLDKGVRVCLGTDGYTFDMWREMKAAYTVHKHDARDPRALPANRVIDMQFRSNAELAALYFGKGIGHLTAGAPADIVVLDYKPPAPLNSSNLPWHVIFGVDSSLVRNTIIDGKVVLEGGVLVGIDEETIKSNARELAADLWQRFSGGD